MGDNQRGSSSSEADRWLQLTCSSLSKRSLCCDKLCTFVKLFEGTLLFLGVCHGGQVCFGICRISQEAMSHMNGVAG